jgi:hypothetical protein
MTAAHPPPNNATVSGPVTRRAAASAPGATTSFGIEPARISVTKSTTAATSAPTGSKIPNAKDKSDNSVRAFLRSIRSSMDTLVPSFTQAGVVSSADLDSVAAMPHLEQTEFLKEDVNLSPLHARLVQLALVRRKHIRAQIEID